MGHIIVERTLNYTEVRYKLILAGKKFALPVNSPVTLACGGKTYSTKTHSALVGRVDGLAAWYRDFPLKEGDRIRLDYDPDANTIYVETVAVSAAHEETPVSREQDAPSAGNASRATPQPSAVTPQPSTATPEPSAQSEEPKDAQSAPYIFASYCSADKKWVLPVLDELRRHGYQYWFDEKILAGSYWNPEINRRLNNCDAFFAFISKSYIYSKEHSGFCMAELNSAFTKHKEILPIFLDDPNTYPDEIKEHLDMRLSGVERIVKSQYDKPYDFAGYVLRLLEEGRKFEAYKQK